MWQDTFTWSECCVHASVKRCCDYIRLRLFFRSNH